MKEFNPADLPAEFVKKYGGSEKDVRVYAAPARINIIGEHIDYNGGKVFPTAIDKYLYVGIRKRDDNKITYQDLKFPGTFVFDATEKLVYKKENSYANYLNGILTIMNSWGHKLPSGFDVLLESNVPPEGGISSSSALECGFAVAVNDTFGFGISAVDIAKLGQQSEHDFMNVNCGIMDQFIIATGKEGTAELLNCATLDYEYVPLNLGDKSFVVMNTNKKRKLADSKYNERRSQCEEGLAILQKAAVDVGGAVGNTSKLKDLCSLTVEQFEKCKSALTDDVILRRVRHCVTENDRVLQAMDAMKAGDLVKLGNLLKASHASLEKDYEVTGIELDTLAHTANSQDGCLGARMTGAGFGGCAIALVENSKIPAFIEAVQKVYTDKIGYAASFFACKTGDGARSLSL